MYVKLKELPACLQNALKSAGYHRADIKLEKCDSVSPQYWANDGSRGYFALVNLATGEKQETYGSWGGPNMFTSPAVDTCEKELPLPDGFIAIKGSVGHQVFLTLYGNANTLVPLLPAPSAELTENEETVLRAHVQLKGGQYRRDAYDRAGLSDPVVKECVLSLAQKGLLKVNKTGASSVTTEGRNTHSQIGRAYV